LSCPSCGESLSGGSERCPACGAMVAPPVHGALAPDARTLPARGRSESPREIPGLRRREKNWQDEVRDRVRKRRKGRGDSPALPLFEPEAGAAAPPAGSGPEEVKAFPVVVESTPEKPRGVAAREWAPPPHEDRAPVFEGRIRDRVDPLDSLTDLPLRPAEGVAPAASPETAERDLAQEFEASPEGSAEQLERGPRRRAGVAQEFEASPEGSAEQLERGPRLGAEGDAHAKAEIDDDEGWSADVPLEPRLEPPPRLVDERPVERPAQALERAQAAALDLVLLAGLSAVVVYFASRFAHVSIDGLWPSWPYLGAYLAFLALVYAVYFTGTTGQTLGKIVYGLRVVDTAGRPPGYLRAAGRAALGALGVVLGGMGLLPVLFDPARRAFHDRVLQTRVIRG
jgi:uncharacterized RDD family membrane protein YckC